MKAFLAGLVALTVALAILAVNIGSGAVNVVKSGHALIERRAQ